MRIDEFEWTNLIILDATRHDLYEEVNGKTQMRRTVGSSSKDFIHRTFTKGNWEDTVVITANPHYHPDLFKEEVGEKPSNVFKKVYNLFTDEDSWNEELGTVPPKKVFEKVNEIKQEHPHQHREGGFIIHMMQPHAPFIDSHIENSPDRDMNVWELLREGEYTDQEMWTAYKNNLEKVMPYTQQIDNELIGTTVITADHGNAFGENGEYGHPDHSANPVLRQVPLDYI